MMIRRGGGEEKGGHYQGGVFILKRSSRMGWQEVWCEDPLIEHLNSLQGFLINASF